MESKAMTHSFTDENLATLQALAGEIIPASEAYSVPGADDPLIFEMVVETMSPHREMLTPLLTALDAAAGNEGGFAALTGEARTQVAEAFLGGQEEIGGLLHILISQCYYRDDRVMESLGMEARAPFPKGFEVEQGDMALLQQVKERAPFWRKVEI